MIVVVTILAALLSAGGYALYLQLQDTRAAGFVTRDRQALFCAEGGLSVARDFVSANQPLWDAMLDADASNDPAGYPVTGDLDGDGDGDFSVTIEDNRDGDGTVASDNDLQVYVVSLCTQFADSPREVRELVEFQTGGGHYRNQAGHGPGNAGNVNRSASP